MMRMPVVAAGGSGATHHLFYAHCNAGRDGAAYFQKILMNDNVVDSRYRPLGVLLLLSSATKKETQHTAMVNRSCTAWRAV